ncbi:MAG: polysaccharide biosynthesis protein [Agathobacter sp.]|nr:polysaccharide biosynthesis protein [Agathobacter sp.]
MLLTGAGIISRILGFFYRIFLSRTIGASGLGLYQLVFPVFGLCLAVSASGIQTAISRFVASEKNGKRYLFAGLFLSITLSCLFSFLIYLLAPWIAKDILKEPRTEELLRVMVFALVPACIHSCFNGYYYGRKNSVIPSACQITEQLARVFGTLVIYNVLLNQGLPLAPIHAIWGMVISELAGLCVNVTAYLGIKQECIDDTEKRNRINSKKYPLFHRINNAAFIFAASKALSITAIPLTLNHVLMTLSHSLENLLLPQQLVAFGYTSDEALGHFGILTGMALSVIFFPSAITNSLSVLLLPRISETKAKGDICVVLDTIKGAICCGVTLGALCTFIFLLSADWFGTYIFNNALAGFYIRILSILCPFMYTSSLLSSIVNGLGHASLTLACNLTGCAIRIFAIWALVPVYGMYAYIISMIVAAVVVTAELVWVVRRKCA